MKILILNWRCPKHPEAGGAEKYLYEISKRLVKKGHEIVWFSANFQRGESVDILDGIKFVRRGGRYSVYLYSLFSFLQSFKKDNFQVIIDNINGVPFFTPLYVKQPKLAIVHHLMKEQFFKELPLPLGIVGYSLERTIPFCYSRVPFVTVSDSSKRELMAMGIKRVEIVPNGIESRFFNFKAINKADAPTILFLGRLKKYKRVDLLLKAFSLLKKKLNSANLWIAGDGDYRAELEKLAIKLDIKNVVFWGYVDEKKKRELLRKSWVLVMPSLREGWGITVIEANACGTPCIAYDVSGLRDSIKNGKTGILVRENGNEEKLAEVLYQFLTNSTLRQRLSQNAIEWARQFSWDRSAEKFERILLNLQQK